MTITLVVPAGLKNSKNTSCWVYLSGLPQLQLRNSNLCPTVHVSMKCDLILVKFDHVNKNIFLNQKQVPSLVTGKIYSYDFIKQQSNIKTNKTVCGSDELIQLSYISTPAPEVYLTKASIMHHRFTCLFSYVPSLILILTFYLTGR